MPQDVAILARFDPYGRPTELIKAVGKTDFVFSVYDNDLQFTNARQLRTVEGTDKLVQGILKILLTKKGENFEDGEYGMVGLDDIGGKISQEHYATIRTGIVDALSYYNQLNLDNDNNDEIIGDINEVKIVRDDTDPRVFLIYISLVTNSGKQVRVTVPQVE